MRRGNPVVLGNRSFTTQKEAVVYFRAMLSRYKPGQLVNRQDEIDLLFLLKRHSEYDKKFGQGVAHFEVINTEYGTKSFGIVRVDASTTDFSYLHCIANRKRSDKHQVLGAFRGVVQKDIFAAKQKFFEEHRLENGKIVCAVTREQIETRDAHVDHVPPMTFEVIVTTFLGSQNMSFEQVPISSGEDNQVQPLITDARLADSFRRYHEKVAVLDVVKRSINLAQSARHRVKDGRVKLA